MPKYSTSSQYTSLTAVLARRRWGEKDARAVLKAWRRSGLSVHAFAHSVGLDAQRLFWWRKRLENAGDLLPPRTEQKPTSSLTLIPTTVVSTARCASVTVRLPRGARIEVADPALVSPAWIAELVAQIRKVAP